MNDNNVKHYPIGVFQARDDRWRLICLNNTDLRVHFYGKNDNIMHPDDMVLLLNSESNFGLQYNKIVVVDPTYKDLTKMIIDLNDNQFSKLLERLGKNEFRSTQNNTREYYPDSKANH